MEGEEPESRRYGDALTDRRLAHLVKHAGQPDGREDNERLRAIGITSVDLRAPDWTLRDAGNGGRVPATQMRWLIERPHEDAATRQLATAITGELSAGGLLSNPEVWWRASGDDGWTRWTAGPGGPSVEEVEAAVRRAGPAGRIR